MSRVETLIQEVREIGKFEPTVDSAISWLAMNGYHPRVNFNIYSRKFEVRVYPLVGLHRMAVASELLEASLDAAIIASEWRNPV